MMKSKIRKEFEFEKANDGWWVASTVSEDRDKDTIDPLGIDLSNYRNNPVMIWGHDYRNPYHVIGRAKDLAVSTLNLKVKPEWRRAVSEFDPMTVIRPLIEQGFVRALSIGFRPLEWSENQSGGYDFHKIELLEISAVPVPANQEALRLAFGDFDADFDAGLKTTNSLSSKDLLVAIKELEIALPEVEEKRVIPYKRTPLAPKGQSWDGPAQRRAADTATLKIICTWYDAENPDTKSSYKLPHHLAAGNHSCVWRGVTAAMGALLGARGGTNIPSGDRRPVYNHLARHYRDFDEEPPSFREADWYDSTLAEIDRLMDEDEDGEKLITLVAEIEAFEDAFLSFKDEDGDEPPNTDSADNSDEETDDQPDLEPEQDDTEEENPDGDDDDTADEGTVANVELTPAEEAQLAEALQSLVDTFAEIIG